MKDGNCDKAVLVVWKFMIHFTKSDTTGVEVYSSLQEQEQITVQKYLHFS